MVLEDEGISGVTSVKSEDTGQDEVVIAYPGDVLDLAFHGCNRTRDQRGTELPLGPEASVEAVCFFLADFAAELCLGCDTEHRGFVQLWPARGFLVDEEADKAGVRGNEDE